MKSDIIECAFQGRVGKDLEVRTSQAGKAWCSLSVAVGGSGTEPPQWVRVAVFGERVTELASTVHKGDRVYIEGRLKLTTWEKNGETRHGLECVAALVQPLGLIGNRKPPKGNCALRGDSKASSHNANDRRTANDDARTPVVSKHITAHQLTVDVAPSNTRRHGAQNATRHAEADTDAPFDDAIPF